MLHTYTARVVQLQTAAQIQLIINRSPVLKVIVFTIEQTKSDITSARQQLPHSTFIIPVLRLTSGPVFFKHSEEESVLIATHMLLHFNKFLELVKSFEFLWDEAELQSFPGLGGMQNQSHPGITS